MSTLHLVSKSPFAHNALHDCLRASGHTASLLLIEDGVIAALANGEWVEKLHASGHRIFVLREDCDARGYADRIDTAFTSIDYAQFVQLCCDHARVVSWY